MPGLSYGCVQNANVLHNHQKWIVGVFFSFPSIVSTVVNYFIKKSLVFFTIKSISLKVEPFNIWKTTNNREVSMANTAFLMRQHRKTLQMHKEQWLILVVYLYVIRMLLSLRTIKSIMIAAIQPSRKEVCVCLLMECRSIPSQSKFLKNGQML